MSFLRCLYAVTITVSTIGYEDLLGIKDSQVMMVYTIVIILFYMVVVTYTISNFTAFLVEGRLKKYFEYRKLCKRIKRMDQHYIICGVKDIGVFAAEELQQTEREFVVIDDDEQNIARLRHEIPSLVYVEGDASDDHILMQAGVEKAAGLIACLQSDKDNLYLVLAAKELNPSLEVAARFNSPRAQKKLLKAGATHLVCPPRIGGLRIASELLRPSVVSFLDSMLRSKASSGIRVEEVAAPEGSSFVGKTLAELHERTGVLVIACRDHAAGDFEYNPSPKKAIKVGMKMIFIGTPKNRQAMDAAVGATA